MLLKRSRLLRYGLAAAFVVVGYLVNQNFLFSSDETAYYLFYPAVFFSVWLGGVGPGIFAGLLSVLAVDFLITPPLYPLIDFSLFEKLQPSVFIFLNALMIWAVYRERRADLRARTEIEERLSRSELKTHVILDSFAEGVLVYDSTGSIIESNPAAKQILGPVLDLLRTPKERTNMGIVKADGAPFTIEEFPSRIAVLTGNPVQNVQMGVPRLNGSLSWLLVNANPLPDSEKQGTGVIVSFADITEQKEHEIALREANRAKDEFLSTLSHELRTPLTAILTWAQLLESGKLDPVKTKAGLQAIVDSAKAQNQLIDDLLDVTRISTGKIVIEPTKLELAGVVRQAVDSVRAQAERKSIHWIEQYDSQKMWVSADPIRLKQVIWNLLTNAIKFTPEGGSIEIGLRPLVDRESPKMQLSIRDSGKGIPPEFLPHLFRRFFQADQSSVKVYGGLGLGLELVRRLVELQGGTVTAFSEGEGKGATFTVTFPAKEALSDAPMAAKGGSMEHPSLQGIRVLLVDNEQSALIAIKEALEYYGAQVDAVASASEAIERVRKAAPDVLVSDIAMPGEDGYTLIRKIRDLDLKNGGEVPAIAFTAYADVQHRDQALMAGYQAHLIKPVDINELARTILRVNRKFSTSVDAA